MNQTVIVDIGATRQPQTIQDGIFDLGGRGGVVFVRRGLYEIDTTILVPSHTRVFGSGLAEVRMKNALEPAFRNEDVVNGNEAVEVDGFRVVVDEAATPYQHHLVYFRNVKKSRIKNIDVSLSREGTTEGIQQAGDLFAAILVYSNILAGENEVSGCGIRDYGVPGHYGIGIMISGAAGMSAGNVLKNNVVKGTIGGMYCHNADDVDILYNRVTETITNNGLLLERCMGAHVEGNRLSGSDGHGMYLSGCKHGTVSVNTVSDNSMSGIKTRFYGADEGDEYNAFIGNTCDNNGGNGIHLQALSSFNTITGNTCIKNAACGIRLQDEGAAGAAKHNVVTGNVCVLHDGDPGDDLPISMGHESNVLGVNTTG